MADRWGSKELREACSALGCTQAQMAGKLEVSERTFRRYVSGKYEIPLGIEYAIRWLLHTAKVDRLRQHRQEPVE